MTPQLINKKLLDSDELASHPGAAVTDSFVNKIKTLYDAGVMDRRVEILFELAKEEYDRSNISSYAITTVAKDNKVHYFLGHEKERTIKAVKKQRIALWRWRNETIGVY